MGSMIEIFHVMDQAQEFTCYDRDAFYEDDEEALPKIPMGVVIVFFSKKPTGNLIEWAIKAENVYITDEFQSWLSRDAYEKADLVGIIRVPQEDRDKIVLELRDKKAISPH